MGASGCQLVACSSFNLLFGRLVVLILYTGHILAGGAIRLRLVARGWLLLARRVGAHRGLVCRLSRVGGAGGRWRRVAARPWLLLLGRVAARLGGRRVTLGLLLAGVVVRWGLVGVPLDVGGRLVGRAGLVGLDGGPEAMLVGDVIDLAVDAVGVGVAVATRPLAVLVAALLVELGASVAVVDVVAPGEGHRRVLDERVRECAFN